LIDRQPDNGEEASYHEGTAQQFIVAEKTAATTTWGRWFSSHLVAVQTEVPQTYERTHRDSRALELCAGIGVITSEPEVYFCIAMAALQLLRCGKFLLPRSWKFLLLLRCSRLILLPLRESLKVERVRETLRGMQRRAYTESVSV